MCVRARYAALRWHLHVLRFTLARPLYISLSLELASLASSCSLSVCFSLALPTISGSESVTGWTKKGPQSRTNTLCSVQSYVKSHLKTRSTRCPHRHLEWSGLRSPVPAPRLRHSGPCRRPIQPQTSTPAHIRRLHSIRSRRRAVRKTPHDLFPEVTEIHMKFVKPLVTARRSLRHRTENVGFLSPVLLCALPNTSCASVAL